MLNARVCRLVSHRSNTWRPTRSSQGVLASISSQAWSSHAAAAPWSWPNSALRMNRARSGTRRGEAMTAT
jgi:hypothetical protein